MLEDLLETRTEGAGDSSTGGTDVFAGIALFSLEDGLGVTCVDDGVGRPGDNVCRNGMSEAGERDGSGDCAIGATRSVGRKLIDGNVSGVGVSDSLELTDSGTSLDSALAIPDIVNEDNNRAK